MKKIVISVCIGVFAAISLTAFSNNTSQALASGVLRLHVRANSNSAEDQKLKLAVRDRILEETKKLTSDAHSTEDAQRLMEENLQHIRKTALEEVKRNGFDYPVSVNVGKSNFPVKAYGNITLPAGTYTALTVDIGSGDGENWWCVMFPPLCFVKETFATFDSASREILIKNLGADTYSMINEGELQIKFKIYELLQLMK